MGCWTAETKAQTSVQVLDPKQRDLAHNIPWNPKGNHYFSFLILHR